MPLEIDMLALGNADAIIVQVYDAYHHATILIDGGNADDGQKVVRHINTWAKGKIDLLINSHPDADHVDGLKTVINELPVAQVLIHDPSAHRKDIKDLIRKFSLSTFKEAQSAYKSLSAANDLINLIDEKRIPRSEPFYGISYSLPENTSLTVVGPTEDYYNELLAGMDEAVELASLVEMRESLERALRAQRGLGTQITTKSQSPEEVLDEKNDESPSNNSSALVLVTYHGLKYLFTADAGPPSLDRASESYNFRTLRWMQVPHHGSRRNLTSELVAHFSPTLAYVSAVGGDDKKHPNPNVVQALKNVGCKVYGTNKSGNLWHHNGAVQDREGYTTAEPL